ncbi:hypothetical protein KB20921_20020 [Edwardsiella ictaluri]|nr:hypothetical protein KH20906_19780 [Edwardsiella ictaluri]BEI02741.1 hypothetical protein KB20921_20020 [Edwardsiella ictaluri]BEI06206.1 hypothetical protein KH201010_19920 [Edwardsiella ictaluri]BEI09665.1 hypothetical protein STU22726_19960 [Edwardsiella ictaluri]BEI13143.1 hypothetical protein STU22816_19960 [Edwardsiella ictaluri]
MRPKDTDIYIRSANTGVLFGDRKVFLDCGQYDYLNAYRCCRRKQIQRLTCNPIQHSPAPSLAPPHFPAKYPSDAALAE